MSSKIPASVRPESESTAGLGLHGRRQPMDFAVRDGAYLAEILGDDEVGGEPAEQLGVHRDDRLAASYSRRTSASMPSRAPPGRSAWP